MDDIVGDHCDTDMVNGHGFLLKIFEILRCDRNLGFLKVLFIYQITSFYDLNLYSVILVFTHININLRFVASCIDILIVT